MLSLATLLLVVAVAAASAAIAGRLPRQLIREKHRLAIGAFVVALIMAGLSGGSGAGIATLGIAAWGVAAAFDPRIGAGAFAIAAMAGAVVGFRTGGVPVAVADGILAFTTGALPYLYAVRLGRVRSQRERRVTRLEAHLSRATPARPMPTANLLRDVLLITERTDAHRDLEMLDSALRDVRDMMGADEAILWEWTEEQDTLRPKAWSTEDAARPEFFRVAEWGPLARWTAEERLVNVDGNDDAPRFGSAPVVGPDRLFGVVTVTSNVGLGLGRDGLRAWLPRVGAQLAAYLELFDMRTQYSRHMHRNQALIEAMERLQIHKSAEALGVAVCETALEVTSGRAAMLIRWLAQDAHGLVQCSSSELTLEPGTVIARETLVGHACSEKLPLLLQDARAITRSEPTYTRTLLQRPIPSLAVVPVLNDDRVIGAIAVEGAEPESLGVEETRNLGLLAAVARGALEKVWEIEDIGLRARTDALTGLFNRRYFDEQLRRVLAETDRFGNNASLIVADIDHFKLVNDRYGHEVGDAVLRQVAKALADGVRNVDICARYGGEEIAILLPQTPLTGAAELAERMRKAIASRPVVHEGTSIAVTVSFGIAGYPDTVPNGDWLFSAADRALYEAKAAGRNCVRLAAASSEMPTNYRSAR